MRRYLLLLFMTLPVLASSSLLAQESENEFDWAYFRSVVEYASENHLYADRADADEAYVGAAEEALRVIPEITLLLHRDYAEEFKTKAPALTGTTIEINPRSSYILFQLDSNGQRQLLNPERTVRNGKKTAGRGELKTPLKYWKKSGFTEADLRIVIDFIEKRQPDSSQRLLFSALNGYLKAYDPHSWMLDKSTFMAASDGKVGLGLLIGKEAATGNVVIVNIIPGSPAMQMGLQHRDTILAVDGRPVFGLTIPEVVEVLRGKLNSTANITVERNQQRLSFQIQRTDIPLPVVESRMLSDGIGIIHLRTFLWAQDADRPTNAFRRELAALQARGMRTLILDLRGNQGGDMGESMEFAALFLKERQTVIRIMRPEEEPARRSIRYGGVPESLPVVVLIDFRSYGGAEIVASALQTHDRALILGERSSGGGSLQSVRPIGPLLIRLTTARFVTARGGSIHLYGVEPDIAVSSEQDGSFPPRFREQDLWNHIPPLQKDSPRAEKIARMQELNVRVQPALKEFEPSLKKRILAGDRVDLQLERSLVIVREYAKRKE